MSTGDYSLVEDVALVKYREEGSILEKLSATKIIYLISNPCEIVLRPLSCKEIETFHAVSIPLKSVGLIRGTSKLPVPFQIIPLTLEHNTLDSQLQKIKIIIYNPSEKFLTLTQGQELAILRILPKTHFLKNIVEFNITINQNKDSLMPLAPRLISENNFITSNSNAKLPKRLTQNLDNFLIFIPSSTVLTPYSSEIVDTGVAVNLPVTFTGLFQPIPCEGDLNPLQVIHTALPPVRNPSYYRKLEITLFNPTSISIYLYKGDSIAILEIFPGYLLSEKLKELQN